MTPPKKIDVALVGIVVTLLLQGGTAVWWAARTDSRVSALESKMQPVAATVETVARLDERTSAMQKASERIERKLDAWEEGRR